MKIVISTSTIFNPEFYPCPYKDDLIDLECLLTDRIYDFFADEYPNICYPVAADVYVDQKYCYGDKWNFTFELDIIDDTLSKEDFMLIVEPLNAWMTASDPIGKISCWVYLVDGDQVLALDNNTKL